jgi:two-component system chemotaxis response regulator CheB
MIPHRPGSGAGRIGSEVARPMMPASRLPLDDARFAVHLVRPDRADRRDARSAVEVRVPRKDIVVIGGSAGAVEVLKSAIDALPADLAAAVLVAIHIPPTSPGRLPEILQRHSALRVDWAHDGEAVEYGRVYVAPADRHLVLEGPCVRVTRAPRENHSRPAIDPLFRSAAFAYGPRVVAVLLSGRLDDGSAGLWAVKERGGTVVVQDPDDAAHPDMPRNALEYTTADHVVAAREVAPLLTRLVEEHADPKDTPASAGLELEVRIAMEANALQEGVLTLGPSTSYTCPECHGVLMRVGERGIPRFRCHTGHAFSLDSLLASLTESVEETLWSALRAVEETVVLLREAAERTREQGEQGSDPRFEEKAREAEQRAELLRRVALRHQALSMETIRAGATADALDDVAAGGA